MHLKIGAPVILLKTISASSALVNGARGVVTGFPRQGGLPIVYFSKSEAAVILKREEWTVRMGNAIVARRSQIPLNLAWAISIHKSQGMSLNSATLDLSKVFEYGQAYVALSRVRKLSGIHLTGTFCMDRIKAHPKVLLFYQGIHFV